MWMLLVRTDIFPFRTACPADLAPARTPLIKRASLSGSILPALLGVCNLLQLSLIRQYGMKQQLGIGMFLILVNFLDLCFLHNLAKIHNNNTVAEMPHDIQIVGYEQIGKLLAPVQIQKKIQHLRLNSDIQR